MVENQRVAKAAVDLMKAAFSRIRTDEERRGGLVILIALYGKNADVVGKTADSNVKKPEVINVTIPVQCLIIDSQLTLHKSSKVIFHFLLFFFRKFVRSIKIIFSYIKMTPMCATFYYITSKCEFINSESL